MLLAGIHGNEALCSIDKDYYMKKNWVFIKIMVLIIVAGISLIQKPGVYKDTPPLFIYFLVAISVFVFSLGFFKGASIRGTLSKGNFQNNPLKVFYDPLPFYHLAAYSAIISGVCGVIHAWIEGTGIDSVSYFYIFIGFPVLFSVYIANRKFIKNSDYSEYENLRK